jgi:hypothetical protein
MSSRFADLDHELKLGARSHGISHDASARVLERVSCELGNGGGNSGLILCIKVQKQRDLASALAGDHDVLLAVDHDRGERLGHARATKAVASSRPRW